MVRIIRVSITFPPGLLKDFDEVISNVGYESRSKAVQEAVRLFISEKKCLQQGKNTYTGVLLMIYKHETRGLESSLTEIQHHHSNIICSTMHIHISEQDCLEAIAVKGEISKIRKLSDELAIKRGVKVLRKIIVSI